MSDENADIKIESVPDKTQVASQDDLIEKNKALERQLEELRNERNNSVNNSRDSGQKNNRLSFISDFITAIMNSLSSSHGDLSRNFGGGVRGAMLAALYQSIFVIGLASISYVAYTAFNTQEQRVFIQNEQTDR